jgi:agmatine deiminase
MEGGSVDFNGAGTLITSTCCLLNPNRNPHLNREQIEGYLRDYYGVEQILWVKEGIIGDDTDGHIDDTVRFVNADTVVTVIEDDAADENYQLLQDNLADLKNAAAERQAAQYRGAADAGGCHYEDQRLPASYANFYIANESVVVPTFRVTGMRRRCGSYRIVFRGQEVVGIDSTDIIWGLGSFHCLSQQEPAVSIAGSDEAPDKGNDGSPRREITFWSPPARSRRRSFFATVCRLGGPEKEADSGYALIAAIGTWL